jgi:hypothetical protein
VEVLGVLLPLALAVALSSVPLSAIVVILLSPRAKQSGPAFLAGWILGLAIVTIAFVIGIAQIPTATLVINQSAVGSIEILIGGALVALGVFTIVRGPVSEKRPMPEWLRRLGRIGPWPAFGIALLLNVRPKALILAFTAGLAMGSTRMSTTEQVVVIVIYVLLGASTVIIPVVMQRFAPEATAKRLTSGRGWLSRNSRAITIIVSLMVGVVIIGDGLSRL